MSGALFSGNMGGDTVVYGRKNANVRVGALAVEKFNTHGGAPSIPLTPGGIYRVECALDTITATIKIGEGPDPSTPPDPNTEAKFSYWDFNWGPYHFVALPTQLSIQVTFSGVVASNLTQLS